jgi:tetratricopeptide (TPR) repeat protein
MGGMMNGEQNDFDTLWDYDDPAGSEARFRARLAAAGMDGEVRLQLLTQIARAQALQRRFDDAHRTLDEVEAALPAASLRSRARYLLERGRVFNSSGEPERARPCFAEALQLTESDPAEAFYAVDAAHMLAIVAPPDEQLEWNRRALALTEGAADPRARRWRGSLLNNIGWTYHAQGDYAAALDYLEQALNASRTAGAPDAIRVARWCVARVRRDLGEVEAALAEQRALWQEYEASGRPSGYVAEEIAECLRLLGDENGARPYFALAYAELSRDPWLVAKEPARLERLLALGRE